MSAEFPFKINGVTCPTPSEFAWSLQDVSASDSGRTIDGTMQKNRICQKEKIGLKWLGKTPAETAQILQMFQPEYISVTYRSPLTNTVVTKTFYVGDRTAPAYWWCFGGRMESITFDIIER